jgi:hypothetical protein
MKNTLVSLSRPGHDHAVGLVYATVTGRADKWFFLSGADTTGERAVRAESCLLEPDCGDTVLVASGGATGANTASYIIAVLARAEPDSAALLLPGGVALRTERGALQVDAQRIALNASERVAIEAPTVAMQGVSGELGFHRLSASVQQVQARFGVVSTLAQSITSTVGRLVQKTRDSFRWTENVDETRAGRMRMQVEERLHISAQHASLLAEGQVKIDGSKIDLG